MVTINPNITNHWLWLDADKLKCWLDLQVLSVSNGSYEGKFVTSVQKLSDRWLVAKSVVSTFLKELAKEDIIRITELAEGKIIIEIPTTVDFKTVKPFYREEYEDQIEIERYYRKQCDDNPIWLEAMRKNHHLTEVELNDRLNEFLSHTIGQSTNHRDFADFKRHFNFWIVKTRYAGDKGTNTNQYRESWQPNKERDDYSSSF